MDNEEKLSNFTQGITDAIAGVVPNVIPAFTGYAEGVDAARDVDFDPEDYDAEDLFAGYFL